MTEGPVLSVLVRIEGRVQGVGFRGWVLSRARAFRINGWVRNRRDGSVEMLFSGPPLSVDSLVNECRQGPRVARVDRISLTPTDPPPLPGFGWLPSV